MRPAWHNLSRLALASLLLAVAAAPLRACPFCPNLSLTFAEQIDKSAAVVLARLVDKPPLPEEYKDTSGDAIGEALQRARSTLVITRVIKGQKLVGQAKEIRLLYLGSAAKGELMIVFGIEADGFVWQGALPLGAAGEKYLDAVLKLPAGGPERLAFFLPRLRDENEAIANDAFAEFARTPYEQVIQLKDHLDRDELWRQTRDEKTTTTLRRLLVTLLGTCGTSEDAQGLRELILSGDEEKMRGLDALIGNYLVLVGESGLRDIEQSFLAGDKIAGREVPYEQTYAAIQAIRFIGQETKRIDRARLAASLRLLLDRPLLADLVIADLARWEDWSAVEPLARLFRISDGENSFVRPNVIRYLQACPTPEGKRQLEALSKLDPQAVAQASLAFPLGGPRPATTSADRKKRKADKDRK